MINHHFKFILLAFLWLCLIKQAYPHSPPGDSSFHPYRVNYWVTGSIIGVGAVANYFGTKYILSKEEVSLIEMEALNESIINSLDAWALSQNPSKIDVYGLYSDITMITAIVLPVSLLFDKKIRHDWLDLLLMYMEVMSITTNIYEWSFFGPTFQNRLRPVCYYDQLPYDERKSGDNRNSFYSGHVATVAASSFFMTKVYCDYHPEICNKKYLLYAAATIPPVLLGYFRVKALRHFPSDVLVGTVIGALCGILIPEIHRFRSKKISLGLYSSPEATGLSMKWELDYRK